MTTRDGRSSVSAAAAAGVGAATTEVGAGPATREEFGPVAPGCAGEQAATVATTRRTVARTRWRIGIPGIAIGRRPRRRRPKMNVGESGDPAAERKRHTGDADDHGGRNRELRSRRARASGG